MRDYGSVLKKNKLNFTIGRLENYQKALDEIVDIKNGVYPEDATTHDDDLVEIEEPNII